MKLIQGNYEKNKKKLEKIKQIKKEAFSRMLEKEMTQNRANKITKKEIYLTIRLILMQDINFYKMKYDDLIEWFQFYDLVASQIGLFTPKEIMTMFPISKTYEKRTPTKPEPDFKDYISVYQTIQENFHIDKPIGEKAMLFLMEYANPYLEQFAIKIMLLTSHIKRLQTGTSPLEDFAKENNISIYRETKDIKGNSIFIDKNGKVEKFKKVKPKYIKIVKK